MTRAGNKVVLINTNDKEIKENIKKSINAIYLEKSYRYKSEVIEKDILDWFNSIKDKITLKHLHHVTNKMPMYAYGFEMSSKLQNIYTKKYGKGIIQKIILNWYESTQKK